MNVPRAVCAFFYVIFGWAESAHACAGFWGQDGSMRSVETLGRKRMAASLGVAPGEGVF